MATMVMNVTEFKAKCLAVLSDVEERGVSFTVTRRGKPVAMLGPVAKRKRAPLTGCLEGKLFVPDEALNEDRSLWWDVVRESGK